MHQVLLDSLERLRQRLEHDDRCLGMFLSGSMANGSADEWSDVDVVAVLRDEQYAELKAEFRAICAADCGPILVWLPEGERDESVNFAFLFEVEDRVHLYDFSIFSANALRQAAWLRPDHILFDKDGSLAAAAGREVHATATFLPDTLRHQINNYWVYLYLNGKYYKRRDVYKMLYVQGVIFQTHLKVLHAFYPQAEWNWWARDIHQLPAAQQDELLVYFSAASPDAIAQALSREMDLFSWDAQVACQRWQVAYPMEIEQGVRKHLGQMGVTHA
jgi:predicted nucleotidyltransferase